MHGKNPAAEKLLLAQGTRLGASSQPCADGVNGAQSCVLQAEAEAAQLLLGGAAGWHTELTEALQAGAREVSAL